MSAAKPCGPPTLCHISGKGLWDGCFGPVLGHFWIVLGHLGAFSQLILAHLGLVLGLSWFVLGSLGPFLSSSWSCLTHIQDKYKI